MRGLEELIVSQHAYDLARCFAYRSTTFPKPHRFTLGDRAQTTPE